MLNFPYYLAAEWMCFISSVLLLKNNDQPFGLFVKLYLFSVVVVETCCFFLIRNNQWIYNLNILVEFIFGIWTIYTVVESKKSKPIFITGSIFFLAAYLLSLAIHKNINAFFDETCTVGSVIMIGLCILYYYTLFMKEEYVNLLTDASFWFIAGYFIFYTANVSFDTFFHQLEEMPVNHKVPLGVIIMDFLNIILYGFWIIAFICLNNKRKFIMPL